MKQGDLSPLVGTLRFALKDLHAQWEETHAVWSDAVAQRFEERHVVPLEPAVTSAVKATERLGIMMMRAYEACSPDRE